MGRRAGGDDLEALPVDDTGTPVVDSQPVGSRAPSRPRVVTLTAAVVVALAVVAVVLVTRGRDDPARDAHLLDLAWHRAQATSAGADDTSGRVRALLAQDTDAHVAAALARVRREERDRLARLGGDAADVHAAEDLVQAAQDAVTQAITLLERRATAAAAYHATGRTGVSLVPGLDPAIATASARADAALERARAAWHVRVATAHPPTFASFDRVVASLGPVTDTRVGARLLLSTDLGLAVVDPDAARTRVHYLDRRRNPAEFVVGRGVVAVSRAGFPGWTLLGDDGLELAIDVPGDAIPASGERLWLLRGQTATAVDRRGTITTETVMFPDGWRLHAEAHGVFVLLSTGRADRPSFRLWEPSGQLDRSVEGLLLAASDDVVAFMRCARGCDLVLIDPRTGDERHVPAPDTDRWSYDRAAFSPDGRHLAVTASSSAATRGVYVVDVASLTGALVPVSVVHAPGAVTWSPDSRRVFFADLTTGDRVTWFRVSDRREHVIRLRPAFADGVRAFDVAVLGR